MTLSERIRSRIKSSGPFEKNDLLMLAAQEIDRLRDYLTTIAFTGMTAGDAEEHARNALTHNA